MFALAPETPDRPAAAIPSRTEIPAADTWDLSSLYASSKDWDADFASLDGLVAPLAAMRGTLNTEAGILAFFTVETQLDRLVEKIYCYAHLKADEDKANTENQSRESKIRAKYAEIAASLAWAQPEILANSGETLQAWAEAESLAGYRHTLKSMIRRKAHTLSEAEESLLAGAGTIFGAPGETYSLLTNADLKFPEIEDENGNLAELSQGRFIGFLESRNREVRKRAFENLYDTYGNVANTVTCTLRTHVRAHNFLAKTRKFDSALAAALQPDNIPVGLYESLIAAVHNALPAFHKYVELRRKQLQLKAIDMYDMYVPIVPEIKVTVDFQEARKWVIEACRPLGEDYVQTLESAFDARWIDIRENRGKRSGAYSSGCYDSLPYILLNYQNRLDDVFTLAHELGHSMHSHLANAAQEPQNAGYPIFLAEIASTANEALLLDYLLRERGDDPAFAAYLLNHCCDGFRGTVYRQTMFAEFEKHIHELDAAGTPLSPDKLNDDYYQLNAKYHGPAVKADERIGREWSRIPHFYYNFYVYKYSTSYCASQIFAEQILDGDITARDKFLGLLAAGGSGDPLDLARDAGVDLTDPGTFSSAFARFERNVDQLTEILQG